MYMLVKQHVFVFNRQSYQQSIVCVKCKALSLCGVLICECNYDREGVIIHQHVFIVHIE